MSYLKWVKAEKLEKQSIKLTKILYYPTKIYADNMSVILRNTFFSYLLFVKLYLVKS